MRNQITLLSFETLEVIGQEADNLWLCFDEETGLFVYLSTEQLESVLQEN